MTRHGRPEDQYGSAPGQGISQPQGMPGDFARQLDEQARDRAERTRLVGATTQLIQHEAWQTAVWLTQQGVQPNRGLRTGNTVVQQVPETNRRNEYTGRWVEAKLAENIPAWILTCGTRLQSDGKRVSRYQHGRALDATGRLLAYTTQLKPVEEPKDKQRDGQPYDRVEVAENIEYAGHNEAYIDEVMYLDYSGGPALFAETSIDSHQPDAAQQPPVTWYRDIFKALAAHRVAPPQQPQQPGQ